MLFAVLLLFFCYLLLFPEAALASTRDGLLLWYHSVLPVLFPFMLLCALLLRFGFLKRLPAFLTVPFQKVFGVSHHGAFAILTGFLCGFPMGAKITSDLQRDGSISEAEARFLYGFVNNLSPAFLMSYLASDQLNLPQYKVLFLCNILGAALLYGMITSVRFRKASKAASDQGPYASVRQHGVADTYEVIDGCIYDTVRNTVKLGVYITVFKILSDAVLSFLPQNRPLLLFLGASIEVTGGIHLVASSVLSFDVKLVMLNALCAFGGLSALAQTVSIAALNKSTLFYYIKSRVAITLLCTALSFVTVLFLSIVLL